jgi:uncharacterized RDD family membrane protein YckC
MITELADDPVFAGAWRRLGAFLIDAVLLGVAGIAAGYFLFDFLVDSGVWGRALGFVVALVYFATLNSRIGNGQTVGKRLLKVRVVSADGSALPLAKAALRFTVLGAAWFLNGAWFPAEVLESPLIYPLAIIVFGVGLSTVYLFVFNRPTRKTLHDLAVSSYVVRSDSRASIVAPPTKRVHVVVLTVLTVAAAAAPFVTSRLAEQEPFDGLLDVYRAINADPDVVHAEVNKGWSSNAAGKGTYLQVIAYLSEPHVDDAAKAGRLARLALQAEPSAMQVETVLVSLVYGYDIGLASAQRAQSYVHTPAEWMAASR